MTDRYIDQDETQVYGPHTSAQLRAVVKPEVAEASALVEHVATQLDEDTHAVGDAVARARTSDHGGRAATGEKTPVLAQALSFLGRFSTHLDSEPAKVDRKRFFVKDGTAHGVGKGGGKVLVALTRIATEAAKSDAGIRDAATWAAEASTLAARLGPVLAHASDEKTTRHGLTPEVSAAMASWGTTYRAAKLIAEGVLTLTGKAGLLPDVFHDLQVPGTAKVTSIPKPATPATPSA